MRTHRTRTLLALAVAWTALTCLPAPARAEGDEAKALLAEIAAAQKDKERSGLADAVAKVPAAFAATQDAAARKQLLGALGKVLKDRKAMAAQTAAAKALGELDDKAAAWKVLSKALPKPKAKEVEPYQNEAIKSAGTLAQDGAIAPLIQLMEKAKSAFAAREAVVALGEFGQSKKRTTVLAALLDTTGKLFAAAQSAAQNPKGGSGGEPWNALGASLIASLNKLTGQNHANAEAWLAAAKEHKKKLDGLFASAAD